MEEQLKYKIVIDDSELNMNQQQFMNQTQGLMVRLKKIFMSKLNY